MTGKLKLYQKLLAFFFIGICTLITVGWGWIAFDTLMESPGLNGSSYYYYRLGRLEFFIYNFLVSLVALVFIITQFYFLVTENPLNLKKTFKHFGFFIVLLSVAEFLLQMRFVGKG